METKAKTDRRILRTKEAIQKAFLEIFSEKEFERITINEIAERANVNRGTVYFHYVDKYDLLDRCIEDHLNQMALSCAHIKSFQRKITDPLEATEALKAGFMYFEDHFLFFSSMLSNQKTTTFRKCLQRVITTMLQKQIDTGDINRDMDLELTIQFTASAFVGMVEWWILNRMPQPPSYMAKQMWRLLDRHRIYSGVPVVLD